MEIDDMASPHWWRGLELHTVSSVYWVGQTGAGGYVDSNNSIHPRRPSSHWLWEGEIPSVESPIVSHAAQATWLLEKNSPLLWLVFFRQPGSSRWLRSSKNFSLLSSSFSVPSPGTGFVL
jgi:hypothetical protein